MAFDPYTLASAMREGAARLSGIESAQLDARVLLKCATGYDDAALIMRAQDILTPDHAAIYFELIARRARHEPIAYITGVREFWSLDFHVTPEVLIPRADSECLIEAVLARRSKNKPWTILDLGVGSGCLLCALLHEMPSARGVGVDASNSALSVAKANAERLGLGSRADFVVSDWGAGLTGGFDIIIANPPYIPEGDRQTLPADVVQYEPGDALFAGATGFAAYEAILRDTPRLLAPGGLLVMEAGDRQATSLADMVAKALPEAVPIIVNDLKGLPRGVLADGKSFTKKD